MGELLKGVFSTFASRWQQVTFIWGTEGGDRRSLEESKGGGAEELTPAAVERELCRGSATLFQLTL